MIFEILEADGFICDHQFDNVLSQVKPSTEMVLLFSTKEINGDIAVDANYIPEFRKKYKKFIEKLSINRTVILFLNSWYKQFSDIFEIAGVTEVIYLDLFLYDTYRKLVVHKYSPLVSSYKIQDKNNYLFLMNKPANIHRIGLLYKLYRNDLLGDCTYSFIIHNSFTDAECRKKMSFLTDNEFNEFYQSTKRSLDLDYDLTQIEQINHTHYTGIPYDFELFNLCNFQLISETHFDTTVWITEKTWISIANKKPFIIASYPGILKKLKSMGFRTFESYTKIPDYDEIKNDDDRLNAIVENVKYWNNNIKDFYSEILKDTEHNYQLFLKRAQFNESIINNFIDNYQLPLNCDFVRAYDNYNNQIWYKGIK
jgi:hypothetical protein